VSLYPVDQLMSDGAPVNDSGTPAQGHYMRYGEVNMPDPNMQEGGKEFNGNLLRSFQLDVYARREREDGTASFERPWITLSIHGNTRTIMGAVVSWDT
jgi:hypothetical protein